MMRSIHQQIMRTILANARCGLLSRKFSSISNTYRIMPMPRLSPSMKHATILKWHISRFEEVQSYQLGLEILVNDLTNDSAAQHVMDIEILEDMYVAKIIGKEGETYTPGEPIALFCEKKSEVEEADNIDMSTCKDAYEYANGTQMVLWQAFVKDDNVRCSCG